METVDFWTQFFNAYLASPDWIKGLAVILAFAAPATVLIGLAWLLLGRRVRDTAGDRLPDPPDPADPLVFSVHRAPDGTLRRYLHPGNGSPVELLTGDAGPVSDD